VQPVYLKAESGQIPELKRVIVAYENQIAMEETLEKSLARVFGQEIKKAREEKSPGTTPLPDKAGKPQALQPLGDQAWDLYQKARKALKEENWTAYGQALRDMEQTLKQIKEGKK
jgi:uncharacterized protein